MIIKVLGSGCKRCLTLGDNVAAALGNLGMQAEIVKVTDYGEIAAHGVMSTPGLAIDDKVVSVGKVLSPAEIEPLLQAAR
ncbi:thioredoxin family protein [Brachymonas denitrificans]|jgi:small redox-active disulfide protein 2|uniref:Small redox-active disulfide protein 2 n=1 Tax=Brachymonas denitrificans DSM 15123 TaxID=1121117 RepID=A0A1H8D506_9BURK|nr:thioredoxin family protein [Brachymonas denitrificans]SEN01834.1 small redox-active disulfide protein 2 [Brachymonas denitrificans DSM 15123]